MSKIGRIPITVDNTQVEIKGQEVHFKGKYAQGVYVLPKFVKVEFLDNQIKLDLIKNNDKNNFLGLHRALLANKIKGASALFEKKLQINGLGFKAELSGGKLKLSLGYSHKIEKSIPKEVAVEIDKTGQQLTFKSADRQILGQICAIIRELRPPEPYKGTGIKYVNEIIKRKAGKTKAATT